MQDKIDCRCSSPAYFKVVFWERCFKWSDQ